MRMNLRFGDGVGFNTSGELRMERRYDGWYVVGRGMCMPVEYEEGVKYIKSREEKSDHEHAAAKFLKGVQRP
jgi:hypothetical protein